MSTIFPNNLFNKGPIFQAQYPTNSAKELFSNSIVNIAKKTLINGVLKVINSATGGIDKMILPAVEIFKNRKEAYILKKLSFFSNPLNAASPISFKTADNVMIDGMIQWSNPEDFKKYTSNPADHSSFHNRKWILFFCPNAVCYEELLYWAQEYSEKSQCNILLFNYRGVVESQEKPHCANDLVLDGDAAFQFLLDKGIESSSIAIHGFSLGGGIGTIVRSLHPDGPIANERSFSSISMLIQGLVYRTLVKKGRGFLLQKAVARMISWIVGKIAGGILREAAWEIDSLKKWDEITGHKWIITGSDDELMQGVGRFFNGLKKKSKSGTKEPFNHIESIGTTHCGPLTAEAEEAHYGYLLQAFN